MANGYDRMGTADFNGDGSPDYVLYNGGTRRTAIWYLNNNIFISGAYGPHYSSGLEPGRAMSQPTWRAGLDVNFYVLGK